MLFRSRALHRVAWSQVCQGARLCLVLTATPPEEAVLSQDQQRARVGKEAGAQIYYCVSTETDTGNALPDVERPLRAPRGALRAPPDSPDYPSALVFVILRIPLGCDWSAIGSTNKDVMWQALLAVTCFQRPQLSEYYKFDESVRLSVRNGVGGVSYGLNAPQLTGLCYPPLSFDFTTNTGK